MNKTRVSAIAGLAFLAAQPAAAEVIRAENDSFITRDVAVVKADAKATWLALISPGKWWNSSHTWSGDAANMTLVPQAGGCFCEKIPEDPDADRPMLEGSVEHMRVIQAFPERVLRLRGGLGPLQSEPATGVLTIVLSETDDGTQIVWEYIVGGPMRYELPVIAKAVDGVMSQQLNGLATLLGRVDAEPAASGGDTAGDEEKPAEDEDSLGKAIDSLRDDG